jgi:hypothetical protein
MGGSPELADIFRASGPAYREENGHRLPRRHLRAMHAIETCRTSELGGHVDECDHCGALRVSYNSCRNRHCPKCQSLDKEMWLEARKRDVLPVRYFHVVFTVPGKLRPVALRNQRVFYNLLFQAVSETLKELAGDPKHLGAEIGFIAVLHTWTRTLLDHPHIHCIVPAGGLALDGKRWIHGKKKFFIYFKVLSRKFRGKLLDYLKKAYESGTLKLVGKIEHLRDREEWGRLVDSLYGQEWVVYPKPSMNAPEDVIDYLGRYTHRVALTNDRIVRWDGERVTIRYRDSRDSNKVRFLNLDSFELIRRFLLHILPDGFMKIRYYGILSNRNRSTKLAKVTEFLLVRGSIEDWRNEGWEDLLLRLTGIDPRICPRCGKGRMVFKEILYPKLSRASP